MAEIAFEARETLRIHELTPRGAGSEPLRVTGPGRLERGYIDRLSGLSAEVELALARERKLEEGLRARAAALEVSQRVERGCQRRIDRLEDRLEERTQALLESERQQKRLALALGSMQREVEMLRAKTAPALAARPSFWRRLLGR